MHLSHQFLSPLRSDVSSRLPDQSGFGCPEPFGSTQHDLIESSLETDVSLTPSGSGSRLLWSQDSAREGWSREGTQRTSKGGSVAKRPFSTSQERFSALAKYTKYPVVCGDLSTAGHGVRERKRVRERKSEREKESEEEKDSEEE